VATWNNLLIEKKKDYKEIYKRVFHNRSSKNDSPCSLNRDHGAIGVKPWINVAVKIKENMNIKSLYAENIL
jgi:hypothetical protein